jgi:hypothetical protein
MDCRVKPGNDEFIAIKIAQNFVDSFSRLPRLMRWTGAS